MKHRDDSISGLSAELGVIGISLDDTVLEQCSYYWDILGAAPKKINLVSRSDLEGGLLRHVGDSLAALGGWLAGGPATLLDVGSGGGLPGIPLALAQPDIRVTLLEPKERKADWLLRIVRDLNLSDRVEVRVSRIEDLPGAFTAGFNYMTARALAPPEKVIPWILPVLGHDSRLLLWHSHQQLETIIKTVRGLDSPRAFELKNTLSHQFSSIDFSSSISAINEVH